MRKISLFIIWITSFILLTINFIQTPNFYSFWPIPILLFLIGILFDGKKYIKRRNDVYIAVVVSSAVSISLGAFSTKLDLFKMIPSISFFIANLIGFIIFLIIPKNKLYKHFIWLIVPFYIIYFIYLPEYTLIRLFGVILYPIFYLFDAYLLKEDEFDKINPFNLLTLFKYITIIIMFSGMIYLTHNHYYLKIEIVKVVIITTYFLQTVSSYLTISLMFDFIYQMVVFSIPLIFYLFTYKYDLSTEIGLKISILQIVLLLISFILIFIYNVLNIRKKELLTK